MRKKHTKNIFGKRWAVTTAIGWRYKATYKEITRSVSIFGIIRAVRALGITKEVKIRREW